MQVFLKTLVICLIICAGCWAYTLIRGESYSPEIKPNETVISGGENKEESKANKNENAEKVSEKTEEYLVKVCFLTNENVLKYVERKSKDTGLENRIKLLLAGPTSAEKNRGLYSEIPSNTKLLWVKEENGNLIINLSENFAQGGGATSVMNRIDQLVKTADMQNTKKPIYLYLNGKKVEYIGGEGVFLKQPLNAN